MIDMEKAAHACLLWANGMTQREIGAFFGYYRDGVTAVNTMIARFIAHNLPDIETKRICGCKFIAPDVQGDGRKELALEAVRRWVGNGGKIRVQYAKAAPRKRYRRRA